MGLFDKKKYLFEKANPSPPTLNLEGLTNVYLPTWQHEDPCSGVRCLPRNVTIMAMAVSHRTDTWKYKQTWSRKSLTLKSYVQTPTMGTKGNQEQIMKPIFLTILVQTYCGLFRLFETIINYGYGCQIFHIKCAQCCNTFSAHGWRFKGTQFEHLGNYVNLGW